MKATTSIAGLLLLAVAAVATYAFLDTGGVGVDGELSELTSEVGEEFEGEAESDSTDDLEADGPPRPGVEEASTPIDDAPAREATTSKDGELRIRVLINDKPVANAHVASLSYPEYLEIKKKLAAQISKKVAGAAAKNNSLALMVEDHGVRTRADAAGVAPVIGAPPTPKAGSGKLNASHILISSSWRSSNREWVGVAAWNDTHFGCQWFRVSDLKKKQVRDFRIQEDKTLVVRVVDTNGKPQPNYPLRFYRPRPKKSASSDARHTTGSDGRLVIEHWQTKMKSAKQRWVVLPEVVYREPYFVAFATESLEKEYTLRVGATGAMSFVIKARDGDPVRESASVQLYAVQKWPKIENSKFSVPSAKQSSSGGKVEFARVGLGLRFKTGVTIGSYFRDRSNFEYPGPMRAGETVRHELRLGTDGIRVNGTVALSEGRALAEGASLAVSFMPPQAAPKVQATKCAADGSFSLYLPFSKAGVYRFALPSVVEKVKLEALRTANVGGAGARVDLGEIVLAEPETIISGRVTTAEGKPLRRARVSLTEKRRVGKREKWLSTHIRTVTTGNDGIFRLVGHSMRGSFRLQVSCSGYVTVYRPVQIGENEIEVRLTQLGSVSLAALIKPGIVSRVRLRARDVKTRASRSTRVRVNKSGTTKFRLGNLKPGVYNLQLEMDGWAAPIWLRKSYRVQSGANAVPGPIDFRNVIKRYAFRLSTASGPVSKKRPVRLMIEVPQIGQVATATIHTVKTSVLTLVAPHPSLAWRAHLTGARPIQGRAIPGTTKVVLPSPSASVRFVVPGIADNVKRFAGSYATLVFQRVKEPGIANVVPVNSRIASFTSGIDRRTATMRSDRASIAFEYPDARYKVTLEVRKSIPWSRFSSNFGSRSSYLPISGINLNGFSSFSRLRTALTHTMSLGEITPNTCGKEHVFKGAEAAVNKAFAALRAKVEARNKKKR